MQKAGHKKLVFVQFYQSHVWTCKQMRPFFVKFSIQPKFRGAIFAEIDVDEMEVRNAYGHNTTILMCPVYLVLSVYGVDKI